MINSRLHSSTSSGARTCTHGSGAIRDCACGTCCCISCSRWRTRCETAMPACDLDAWLLDCGFPAQGYDATIDNQTTPLMKASHVGDAAIVNLLIQRGVSVNARNSDGNNALWFACISRSE